MLGSTILGRVTLKQRPAYSEGVRRGHSGEQTPWSKSRLVGSQQSLESVWLEHNDRRGGHEGESEVKRLLGTVAWRPA